MSENLEAVQDVQATEEGTLLGSEGASDNLDWKSSLSEDLRNDPTLSNFKDVESLAKTVVHQQKAMGNRVPIPKTDEERAELYGKLGRPEEANGYEINVPSELDPYFSEESLGEFRTVAHNIGLSQQQVNALIEYQSGAIQGELQNEPSHLAAQKIETEDALKSEWGAEYQRNINAAQRALQVYGDEDIIELMNTSAGNHPAVVKMFARLGKEITEDMAKNTQTSNLAVSPLDAKDEIQSIYATPNHAYFDNKNPEHKAAVERVRQLHEKVYGN